MLTLENLKEYLYYNPDDGSFTWIKSPAQRVKAGDRADRIHASSGYCRVKFLYVNYLAHRLAWFYMTGSFPDKGLEIDHKDTIHHNNIWSNLRIATKSQNQINKKTPANNKSGCKGVYRNCKGWIARPCLNGLKISLGTFSSKEEAILTYTEWARINHGEFVHHSIN